MTMNRAIRRLLPWASSLLLSAGMALGVVVAMDIALENSHKGLLATEVKRRSVELTAATLNGNVMGSVAALGLVNEPIKSVARGVLPPGDPVVMKTLGAIGESYHANGVYVVNADGIIQSCWYTMGVSLTGVDVKFRPYFQIAKQGRQNVYAAVGTTTGQRSLYFAAPLYGEASPRAPIIGAMVARLDLQRIDSTLKAWPGPALLLSPQGVTFAGNHEDWVLNLAGECTPEQLQAIRAVKQFGNVFETSTHRSLPFDATREVVNVGNRRYAVARAPVQWNDPHGEWTLLLLGNLDDLLPVSRRAMIGGASGALMLALCALMLFWRRRMQNADQERQRAETELKEYAGKLESDSSNKSFLAEVSGDLHRAVSLAEFARKFMLHVPPRLSMNYAVFYVLQEDSRHLIPVGSYGALPHNLEKVGLGDGLVGQCARDFTPMTINNSTQTGIRIFWGGGGITPKSVLLVPVAQAGRCLGVVVTAALQLIAPQQQTLLYEMMPLVAMNLEILERNLATQRQAEALLRQQTQNLETEAWYRGVIESAPDGMLVADDNGVVILANPRMDALFGALPGALVGMNIARLLPTAVPAHPAESGEDDLPDVPAQAVGDRNRNMIGIRQDGTEVLVEVRMSSLPALGGHSRCVCASVREITQSGHAQPPPDPQYR